MSVLHRVGRAILCGLKDLALGTIAVVGLGVGYVAVANDITLFDAADAIQTIWTDTVTSGTHTGANTYGFKLLDGTAGEDTAADVTAQNALKVDGSAATQPISGAVQITDGAEQATVRDTGSSDSLNVAITDASGNQVTSFGGTSATDDAAFTAAAGSVTPIGGCETSDDVNAGDTGCIAMTDDRAMHITVYDEAGDSAMDGANDALRVNVVSGPAGGTSTTDDSAFTIGTTAVTPMGCIEATDSVDAGDVGGVKCGADRELDIDIVSAPTGASSITMQGTAADDAAVSGSPVRAGCRADADERAAVSADNDTVDLMCDRYGRLLVLDGHPAPEAPVVLNATASGNTTVIAAGGAGVQICVKKGFIANRDTTNRLIKLQDGAGGTTRWQGEIAAEGGALPINFGERGWCLTANTLLNVNLDSAGSVDVDISEYYLFTP